MKNVYIPKSYKKPSERVKKSRVKRTGVPFLGILMSIIVIIVIGYVLYSPILNISSITVEVEDEILQKEIMSRSEDFINNQNSFIYNNNNIFLTRIDLLEQYILKEFPQIKTITITRTLNRTMNIVIVLRTPLAKICEADICSILSEDGINMGNDSALLSSIQPEIRGVSLGNRGESVVSDREVRWLKTIITEYNTLEGVRINSIQVQQKAENRIIDVHVYTEQGYYIMLDLDTDIMYQARALNKVFISQLPLEQRSRLEYIDLRIKDRVYYKFKE